MEPCAQRQGRLAEAAAGQVEVGPGLDPTRRPHGLGGLRINIDIERANIDRDVDI